jgi:hypothetical protein
MDAEPSARFLALRARRTLYPPEAVFRSMTPEFTTNFHTAIFQRQNVQHVLVAGPKPTRAVGPGLNDERDGTERKLTRLVPVSCV